MRGRPFTTLMIALSLVVCFSSGPTMAQDSTDPTPDPRNGADDGPIPAVDDTDVLPTEEVPPADPDIADVDSGDAPDEPEAPAADDSDDGDAPDEPEAPAADDSDDGDTPDEPEPAPEPELEEDDAAAAGTRLRDRRRGYDPALPRYEGEQPGGVATGYVTLDYERKTVFVPFLTLNPDAAPPVRALFRVMVAEGDDAVELVRRSGHVYTDNGATYEARRPAGSDADDPRLVELFVVHVVLQSEDVVFRGREWIVVLQWVDTLRDLGVALDEVARQLGITEAEAAQTLGLPAPAPEVTPPAGSETPPAEHDPDDSSDSGTPSEGEAAVARR